MKLLIALLAGGVFVTGDLPNPDSGECAAADVVVARTEPTMIDTDGEITGLRVWLICGFQYPGTSGVINKDDTFVLELDADQAAVIIDAAGELVEG